MGSVTTGDETWVFRHELAGHVAMWAVRQSPYLVPQNLELVLETFQRAISGFFELAPSHKGGMRAFRTQREVVAFLEEHLFSIPEVRAWNAPKIERQGALSTYTPDYDFIDLYALAQNVAMDIITYEEDCRRRGVSSAVTRREPHEDQTD